MQRPSVQDIKQILPDVEDLQFIAQGGQKFVFSGTMAHNKWAFKFIEFPSNEDTEEHEAECRALVERARREIGTMRQCSSRNLVRMGPVELTEANIGQRKFVYYAEEYVEGTNLRELKNREGTFQVSEILRLGYEISDAISALTSCDKVHRDIKPENIVKRAADGVFVLLDLGLLLDKNDTSLSCGIVGTPLYFSPEQLDFVNRKGSLGFRSDLFSLGIVMYELVTGVHPFKCNSKSSEDVLKNILNMDPVEPKELRPDLPESLSAIIMRLLSKRPALRYRSIESFRTALSDVSVGGL